MDSKVQANPKVQANSYSRSPLQAFITSPQSAVDFDLWAVAVRQQMLATIRRREGSRSNWARTQQRA